MWLGQTTRGGIFSLKLRLSRRTSSCDCGTKGVERGEPLRVVNAEEIIKAIAEWGSSGCIDNGPPARARTLHARHVRDASINLVGLQRCENNSDKLSVRSPSENQIRKSKSCCVRLGARLFKSNALFFSAVFAFGAATHAGRLVVSVGMGRGA